MSRRDRFTALREKRSAVKLAETSGQVADSLDVRIALMERVKAGEMTLEQAQGELKKIKRSARSNGLSTRAQVYRES